MIIFGTKGYLHQLAVVMLICGRCGNPAAHTLRKHVTKFTLFFVPLFPFSTKYTTQCTFCGVELKVPKEQADQLLLQSTAPGPGMSGSQAYGPGQQDGPRPGQQNPYQS